jgi:hydroxymethylpyrimidine pyrophosphatase-like HAD family hydrolase
MRYFAVAADYDGTLASSGTVADSTLDAIERLLASGRKFLVVTGRVLPDLLEVFPQVSLCERVVAENGAVLYTPATKDIRLLAPPPIPAFVEELRRRNVTPLHVGETIIATCSPYEKIILEMIRDFGLELRIIFNKGAVMVLPAGINKGSGLLAALDELDLSPHNTVGIGDAENDHALLNLCEYAAAVQNAIPMLKKAADRTTDRDHGAGVVEIIDALLHDDLEAADQTVSRHGVLLGSRENGEEVFLDPARKSLLLAGTSGSGKSMFATGLLHRLGQCGYQCCLIDPEGDYENFPHAIMFGTAQRGPTLDEVIKGLASPRNHVVVNLVGLPLQDRPAFFLGLLPRLQEMGVKTGRPHWMLLDETHHLLPTTYKAAPLIFARKLFSTIYVTVHPDQIERSILESVDTVIALGERPDQTIRSYCTAIQKPAPALDVSHLQPNRAFVWNRSVDEEPFSMHMAPSNVERQRHRRKYAEGELPLDRCFYFTGPSGQLNLRAHNLILFMQLGEGVDDATWLHHLREHHYSTWMLEAIKDDILATAVRRIENQGYLTPTESRHLIRTTIEERYTIPARDSEHGSC